MGNVEHTVVLHPYNPFSFEFGAQEACIFKGQMMMDSNVEVLVTGGCPGSDNFDVTFLDPFYLCKKSVNHFLKLLIGNLFFRLQW